MTGLIIELAAALGMQVVAEGIEQLEELERMVELGCTSGQGFLLGRPVPAAELTELLRRELE